MQQGHGDEEEQLSQQDLDNLHNPKYLKELLAKARSASMKAKLYLEYLGICHFNVAVHPDSIIQFSEGDVRALAGIEENHEQAAQVQHTTYLCN